jgi:acyl-coenzyme A thioesterase PaaI-like protein
MTSFTPESMHAFLRESLPLRDDFGERVEEVSDGFVRLSLELRPEHLSHDLPRGSGQKVLSGPLMMGLSDTAMYAAVHTSYGRDVFASIISMNISFLRLPSIDRIHVEARVLRRARSICFTEARLGSTAGGEPVAHATASYAVKAPKAG